MNGRWAMMAVAGILFTSALGISDGKWFLSGAKPTEIPTLALLSIQFPVMGMLEAKRLDGYQATGGVRLDPPPRRSQVLTRTALLSQLTPHHRQAGGSACPCTCDHDADRVICARVCFSVGPDEQLPLRPHGHGLPGPPGEGGEERPSCYGATTALVHLVALLPPLGCLCSMEEQWVSFCCK
jgi:hypothetical protein